MFYLNFRQDVYCNLHWCFICALEKLFVCVFLLMSFLGFPLPEKIIFGTALLVFYFIHVLRSGTEQFNINLS
jgi:hypothetical protein